MSSWGYNPFSLWSYNPTYNSYGSILHGSLIADLMMSKIEAYQHVCSWNPSLQWLKKTHAFGQPVTVRPGFDSAWPYGAQRVQR